MAWPLLLELRFRCAEDAAPPELLQRITAAMETVVLRPGDVEQLRLLRTSANSGKCPAVSPRTLMELAAAVAGNPRAHSINTRLSALTLLGNLAAEAGDFETARDAMRESIAFAVRSSPAWLHATMESAARAASNLNSYDEAVAFIKEVSSGQEDALRSNNVTVHLKLKSQSDGSNPDAAEGTETPVKRVPAGRS
jgi:hypothetical protein